MNGTMQSCIDTQRECKQLGGSITVINSIEEYEQLTRNVLNILTPFQDRNFNVHNQQDDISNGCAAITVEDQLLLNNIVNIVDIDCFTAHLVDSIICESSDVHITEICPEARTTKSMATAKKTEYTSNAFTRPSKENVSGVAVITSSVVVTVAIILLILLLIRRKQRTKLGNDTHIVEYQDYVSEDVRRYALHTPAAQNTITANEVVYQDVINNTEYPGTAFEVAHHDTAAEEVVLYDDTAVEVVPVYQNSENNVYPSPNCYKFIRVNRNWRSCIDAQRECEKVGGNITVINSVSEYQQLTSNVLYILSVFGDSTFNVHVQNLPQGTGCATITVQDELILSNSVTITNTDCTTTCMVDTIVCESTGVHTGICPVQGATKAMPTSTQPVHGYTSIGFLHSSKGTLSGMKVGPNLLIVAVVASSAVVTIAMILLSFLQIRRRQRTTKPGNDKPVDKGEYQDYVAEDVHDYATHNSVVQNQKTTADEVVYQDVKDYSEYLYHNTAAVEVVYHDTVVKQLYHDTGVKVAYHNSGIAHAIVGGQTSPTLSHKDTDRHQKVTSSPDCVENSVRDSESRGRGKGSEFHFSDDYNEINACMPNENKDVEPNYYLQIIG
ncbi:uncharacterized protein LOC117106325 [Anneissia japonica]|uniref:uncharacterized protein LOC117106325 n=1 Tax=Anneissia japonica TaxID=1529436 RepID=UPI0014257264|nr:uncharacterized protein LOC117106325 [Anneissia japonica]